jgi:hypothetical protein
MLQTLEDSGWQVKQAIGQVIKGLRDAIPGDVELLNFVLTDGVTVWAYRQGHGLYYLYCAGEIVAPRRGPRTPRPGTAGVPYSAVASQPPGPLQGDWVALADGQLVTLTGQEAPLVENIEAYFGATQLQR